MRRAIAALAAALMGTVPLAAATAQKKKSTIHNPAATKTPVRRGKRKTPARPVQTAHSTWRPGQTAPTPERYKEIQEALAKKGYLHGEANGKWDQDSADALRRFQQDQNLETSGKLDSLSIVALGLGPKH